MKPKLIPTVVAIAACAAVALTGVATAGGPADTKVTIRVEGGDYHGKVKSDRQSCVNERKVKLFKERGGEQGGGDDQQVGSDTAGSDGEWNVQNSGSHGKHYARAGKIAGQCKADNSRTLRTEN